MSMQTDVLWRHAVRLKEASKNEPNLEKAGELILQSAKWFEMWSNSVRGRSNAVHM